MDKRSYTDEELLAQVARAREAARIADQIEPRAHHAWYDREADRIVVELKSGAGFSLPPSMLDELDGFTSDQLAGVRPHAHGEALAWDELDVHISVPGILAHILGPEMVRAFARKGGQARGGRKAAAARENGRKGGRPRTKI